MPKTTTLWTYSTPAPASVTNAQLATMASSRIKGRATAGTGAPEDLTAAQVLTLLGIADPLDFQGALDASANPNYPAGTKGDFYKVSVAGKVGGASGKVVSAGDGLLCTATAASGAEAAVGTSWTVIEGNIEGITAAGLALVTLANPGAITFLRVNADNTVTALSAADFKAALGQPVEITVACSDEATSVAAGTAKLTFRMPFAMTVTAVRASVTTAPTGASLIVDINESGTTILSTKLSVDATEKTSQTAATPPVISDPALADDAEITIDFDQVGSTEPGKGVKVTLIGTRA